MRKISLLLIAGMFVLFGASFILAGVGNYDGGGFDMRYGYGNMMVGSYGMGLGLFGWIVALLIITVLVLLVILLYKKIKGLNK